MSKIIQDSIAEASMIIGKTWPLYNFVASNPLAGLETMPFEQAVATAQDHLNTHAFPSAKSYRTAWNTGAIDKEILQPLLQAEGLFGAPEHYLQCLEMQQGAENLNANHTADRFMVKWLSAFLDEGLAEWEIPYKSEGFYAAWRLLVIYDSELGITELKHIPKTSAEALALLLNDHPEKDYVAIFTHHLAALPGWTGYINHRTHSDSDWQQHFPISLTDYLAARLYTTKKLHHALLPLKKEVDSNDLANTLQLVFLKAWEQSWQSKLISTLEKQEVQIKKSTKTDLPEAQLVFCIDTRSELLRRHVEAAGNFETFGYAGFFGIAMEYQHPADGLTRKSCPPIVTTAYRVSEYKQADKHAQFLSYNKKNEMRRFRDYFLMRMKNMLPSAFGYVEGSGFFYAMSLIARTIMPAALYRKQQNAAEPCAAICETHIRKTDADAHGQLNLTLEEQVGIVKSAFDLMGWTRFAPLVLFVGHGSHSTNNPFASSLDCGACAANPGRQNARMLAALANSTKVRQTLAAIHQIEIPHDTLFIGAEHNTTTEAITLFDAQVPDGHRPLIANLKVKLLKVQHTATQDRLGVHRKSVSLAQQKASDWGETRPEWGLAKNAGFIIASRELTKNANLDSRCFLHSYNWEKDCTGKALEAIMQGPMVVTQWINNHYYFSTIDNAIYGGGSKITHNITGKFGVVQGNGGDLKMGLPLQSLYQSDDVLHHEPLRLTVMIQTPIARVTDILQRNPQLKSLLDNEWIYALLMDPTRNNRIFRYKKSNQWICNKTNKETTALSNADRPVITLNEVVN